MQRLSSTIFPCLSVVPPPSVTSPINDVLDYTDLYGYDPGNMSSSSYNNMAGIYKMDFPPWTLSFFNTFMSWIWAFLLDSIGSPAWFIMSAGLGETKFWTRHLRLIYMIFVIYPYTLYIFIHTCHMSLRPLWPLAAEAKYAAVHDLFGQIECRNFLTTQGSKNHSISQIPNVRT